MARPKLLSMEDVFKLCDELSAIGTAPSVRLIQSRLGGATGDLAAYLREWRKQSAIFPAATEIPAELKAALALHIQQEISRATTDLKASLQGSEEDCTTLGETLSSKEVVIVELESAKQDLSQQLLKVSAEITFLNARIESLEAKSAQSQERELVAEKRAAHAEGRLQELLRQRHGSEAP